MTSEASVLFQVFLALNLFRGCAAASLLPLLAGQTAAPTLPFEVSAFTEEAAGSRREILSEWGPQGLDEISTPLGIHFVAEVSHLTSPCCFLVCAA